MSRKTAVRVSQTVEFTDLVEKIRSRKDFLAFLSALRKDLRLNPDDWGNANLGSFLEALQSWVGDMNGYYHNRGETVPDQPTWKTLGQILSAARIYE